MPNTTLTADIIAKEALAILENELGWLKKIHRAYEDEFSNKVNGYKVGETISIRRPADFTVRTGAVMSTQDVIEGKVALTVDQQVGVDFQFSSTDLTLKISDLSERVIKPALSNIINHVSKDVLTQMYRGSYSWVGTPGNKVANFAGFAAAPERLDEMAVPTAERCAVLAPADNWGLIGSQTNLYIQGAANDAYRKGSLGEIGGVDTYMSQVVPAHVNGARGGAPVVAAAGQVVTYDAVKNTWTQTFNVSGATAAVVGWAKAGDVFTIANVFMVNPKTKDATNILQQFVVTADVTSAATTPLVISPPIITSGPHQTVNAAPANGAALTFLGAAGASSRQNLAFHKNAMALAVVPMESPQGAVNVSRESYKGLSVRVIPTYDGLNDISKWRLDMLYGRKLIDNRLLTRLSGT